MHNRTTRTSRSIVASAFAAATIASLSPGAGHATTISPAPTFNVQITIASACSITTSPTTINFGTPSKPLNDSSYTSSPITGSTTFQITCTSGTTPTSMALDWGQNATGSPRKMKLSTNFIAYNLYSDSGYATVWTPTTGGPTILAGAGSAQTYTIYAKVTETVTPPAGTYTDTVTLTVTY